MQACIIYINPTSYVTYAIHRMHADLPHPMPQESSLAAWGGGGGELPPPPATGLSATVPNHV